MAEIFEEGSKVIVTKAPREFRHWEGRECTLYAMDTRDDDLPYRVVDANGDDIWVHNVQTAPQPNQTTTQGNIKMSKITAIVSRAKSATVTAASIQAGKALNTAVIKAAKAKAPMMVRGYLDHPVAPALLAVALVSCSEVLPEGVNKAKICKAADLMLTAAIMDGADKFLNVESLIDSVFQGLPAEVMAVINE